MITCKFKKIPGSRRVIWAITNYCNYACRYCIFSSGPKFELKQITTADAERIILRLKQLGFNYIKFTGGEPFARDDMLDILNLAEQHGFDFDISTNASLITNSIASRLNKLKKLRYVHVGLDGFNQESQELVRGKDSYIPTILGIVRLTDNNVPIRTGCVITSLNENELHNIVDFNVELGVKNIAFSLMEPVGRLQNKDTYLHKRTLESLSEDLKELKKYYPHLNITDNFSGSDTNYMYDSCPAGVDFLQIDFNGNITPCPWIAEYTDYYSKHFSEYQTNTQFQECTDCPAKTKIHALQWLRNE